MNIEQMLKRHTAGEPEAAESENIEDLGGYGVVRGIRDRCFSVELRKKDDTVLAIPNALIEQFLYSPNDGITLRAAGRDIRIRGRHLNDVTSKPLSLFSGLARQRASWVVEQSRPNALRPENIVIVESISW